MFGVTNVTDSGLKYLHDLPNLSMLGVTGCNKLTSQGKAEMKEKLQKPAWIH
jgi:hypothetical protein